MQGPPKPSGQKVVKQKITFTVTPKPNPKGGSIINVQVSTPKPYKASIHTNNKDYYSGSTYRPVSTTAPTPLDSYYNSGTTPGYPNTEYNISDKSKSDSGKDYGQDGHIDRRTMVDQEPMASFESPVIYPPGSSRPFDFPHFGKSPYDKHHRKPDHRRPTYKDGAPPSTHSVEHHYYQSSRQQPSEEIFGTEYGPSKPTPAVRHEVTYGSELDDDDDFERRPSKPTRPNDFLNTHEDDFRDEYSHSSRYESDSDEPRGVEYGRYDGKKKKYGNKGKHYSSEEVDGAKYSQPDPLYHPEGNVFKSNEQVSAMNPPARFDNSYSNTFNDKPLGECKVILTL